MKRDFTALDLVLGPAAGLMFVMLFVTSIGPALASEDYLGVVACILVALLAEAAAMDFRVGDGSDQPQSSLAFLPFLGSIILFAPIVTGLLVAFVVAISQLRIRRNRIARAVFNVCQATLSTVFAGVAYHTLTPAAHEGVNYIGFALAAAIFFSTNIVSSSFAISFLNHQPFIRTLQQVAGPNGSNLWYDLLASPVALMLVVFYALFDPYNVVGILIVALPLILINYSYLSTQKVMKANQDLLRALVKAIETRDPYTSGHSVRVATLAKVIATDLGLSFWRTHKVETAAILHDIGKIDPIYAAVLRKPFDLNAEERALIQTHASRGAAMLQGLRSMDKDVVAAVLHHHERFDGAGYPTGLAGTEIPLTARIIMLCDSVDAMLSDRPYRKALTLDAVRKELMRCSGTQFDPEIVTIMLERGTLEKAVELIGAIVTEETVTLMAV